MSIDANTYEEMRINLSDESCKALARAYGKYLLKTWGISSLWIEADGNNFFTDEEEVEENSEIGKACAALDTFESVSINLMSENNGGLSWRRELFLDMLKNSPDLYMGNVVYRSMDYYDVTPDIDLCVFDSNGLCFPECPGETGFEIVSDVTAWYCGTPEIRITTDDPDNAELHDRVLGIMEQILQVVSDDDEIEVEDEWEDEGELLLSDSIRISGENAKIMKERLQKLTCCVAENRSLKMELHLNFVSDSEDDYPFSVLSYTIENGEIRMRGTVI